MKDCKKHPQTSMGDIIIENLSLHVHCIPLLANWHFKQWGDMTGAFAESDYNQMLLRHASAQRVPMTLVAVYEGVLLGSVNIVECDMQIRSALSPWLAQLYVQPAERSRGIGSALVQAALDQSKKLGYDYLYLYTSGALPFFYIRNGWKLRETVHYKGKDRTVMEVKLR